MFIYCILSPSELFLQAARALTRFLLLCASACLFCYNGDCTLYCAGENTRTEWRHVAGSMSAVLGQVRRAHQANCTGDTWRSSAGNHGQHDRRGLLTVDCWLLIDVVWRADAAVLRRPYHDCRLDCGARFEKCPPVIYVKINAIILVD